LQHRLPREAGGLLFHGDNYDALRYLLEEGKLSGQIRLVYIDPPFGTRQSFTFSDQRSATVSRPNGGRVAYSDTLTGADYLKFLGERLLLIRELMAEDGSIYVHIDTKMGHYVKCLMDKIFGQKHFLNDITRIKCNPKNFQRRGYGNTKDMVLFYSKGERFVWNEPRRPLNVETDPRFTSSSPEGRNTPPAKPGTA
jgi:adenine-specific DNA-methyltransferase